jgi:hypothetical protein
MPLFTPDRAERVNMTVTPAMMTISTKVESSMPKTRPAPSAISDAPRPSEVQVPNRVAMTARMSTTLPAQPSMDLPSRGRRMGETSPVFPRTWVE